MSFFLRLFFCLILLHTVGCMSQQKILIKVKPKKQCLALCAQRFQSCKAICVNNCSTCSVGATQRALNNFINYVQEERIEGGAVTRGLKSYRDPLQCRKVTCNCYADLSTCEQNCAGIIHKQLRTVPYCV